MTPKEKSKELIDKFYQTTPNECFYNPPIGSITSAKYTSYGQAIQCALIAVDEIGKVTVAYNDTQHENIYWQEVKNEILKLQSNVTQREK